MYDKKNLKSNTTSHALDHTPRCHKLSHLLGPRKPDVLYGRPLTLTIIIIRSNNYRMITKFSFKKPRSEISESSDCLFATPADAHACKPYVLQYYYNRPMMTF